MRPYQLPLRQCWQTAQTRFSVREGWLIQLHDDSGRVGLGDCAPLPEVGTESMQQAQAQLEAVLHRLDGRDPEAIFADLDNLVQTPAARCGLEMALIDLMAKAQTISAARWLNVAACESVAVNQNAGTPAVMLASTVDAPFVLVKLKVGVLSVDEELAQLRQLAQRYPASRFRLDANQGWSRQDAEQFIRGCDGLPIEALEEPLGQIDFQGLADLQEQADFPLALDESLARLDWSTVLAQRPVKRVVLKPMREGGIAVAWGKAQQLQAAGMECVLTTTIDSAVGVWATIHLAAALGVAGQDLAHGLATSSWLAQDLLPVEAGLAERIYLPDRPGFGIDLGQITIP